MGIEKKVLSTRLDEDIIEELKRLAEKENRSVSNYIETLIKKHLSELKQK